MLKLSKKFYFPFFIFLAVLYSGISFFYLDKYPTLYGDESFYSEPSVNFLQYKDFRTHLYPPIFGYDKSILVHGRIYAVVQALIFKFFGVTLVTMRIQSFVAGLLSLMLLYLISKKLFERDSVALFSTLFLAFSHLFIFASHFARPDMAVALFILASVYFLIEGKTKNSSVFYFLSGCLGGIIIDVHPSGSVGMFVPFAIVTGQLITKKISWKNFLICLSGIATGILWWITLHVFIDPKLFFEQWVSINKRHPDGFVNRGFISLFSDELNRWYSFFWQGAYHRNMALLLLFFVSILHGLKKIKEENYQFILLAIAGAYIGYLLGPAKATWYIIYIYPFLTLLASLFIFDFYAAGRFQKMVALVFMFSTLTLLAGETFEMLRFYNSNYPSYTENIKKYVPFNATILASDNQWLGFHNCEKFIPYHVMGHWLTLRNSNMPIPSFIFGTYEEFFRRQNINYIIADQELLDWSGNKETLTPFIEKNCELLAEISDPFYGSSNYMSKRSPKPLLTKIYKVVR